MRDDYDEFVVYMFEFEEQVIGYEYRYGVDGFVMRQGGLRDFWIRRLVLRHAAGTHGGIRYLLGSVSLNARYGTRWTLCSQPASATITSSSSLHRRTSSSCFGLTRTRRQPVRVPLHCSCSHPLSLVRRTDTHPETLGHRRRQRHHGPWLVARTSCVSNTVWVLTALGGTATAK